MTQQPIKSKREVEKIILPSNVLEYLSEYSPPAFDKEPKVIEINHATYACKLAYAASKQVGEENRMLREAAGELLHLHLCEQEGLLSGKPTANQWLNAVDKLSEALASVSDGKQKEE